MATAYHNLSDYDFNSVPNAENMRFGIVVSEWNNNITGPLLEGAISTLKKHGAKDKNILVQTCLLYTSPSPRDTTPSRMPSSA